MLYFLFLYATLADPEWHRREAASAAILSLVDRHPAIYGPRLAELGKDATEPEVVSRVRRPLAVYARWRLNSFVPTGTPVYPCCDCIPAANPLVPFGLAPDIRDKPAGWSWYCNRAKCVPGSESAPYWARYRAGTERMVRSMLLDGADPGEVDRVLSRMWVIEKSVKGDNASAWPEAESWMQWQGGYPRPRE